MEVFTPMARYIYSGPMSAATLGDGTDVILMNGREITLPDDNDWVKSLVAQGRLAPAAKKASTTTANTGTPKAQAKPAAQSAAEKESK